MADKTTKRAAVAADEETTAAETPSAPATSEAAPLEPAERAQQREPVLGHEHSTTNHVAAYAALRSVSGSQHEGLVDEAGNPVDVEDVFEFPGEGNPRTVARVKRRLFESFRYPNTSTVTTQLLYPEGAEVPLWQAHQMVAKYKHMAETRAAGSGS